MAFDLFMGVMGDRTRTRWGKFRPYLLWFAVPFGIISTLTFTTPGFSPNGKLIYAYITLCLMMMVYSAINIPYSALMGVISPDSQERTSVSSYRFAFAFGAGLMVQYSTLYLVDYFGRVRPEMGGMLLAAAKAHGYQLTMGIYAIAATALFFLTFALTKERCSRLRRKARWARTDRPGNQCALADSLFDRNADGLLGGHPQRRYPLLLPVLRGQRENWPPLSWSPARCSRCWDRSPFNTSRDSPAERPLTSAWRCWALSSWLFLTG